MRTIQDDEMLLRLLNRLVVAVEVIAQAVIDMQEEDQPDLFEEPDNGQ